MLKIFLYIQKKSNLVVWLCERLYWDVDKTHYDIAFLNEIIICFVKTFSCKTNFFFLNKCICQDIRKLILVSLLSTMTVFVIVTSY